MSLPVLLTDLAEEAKVYADPDQAIGALRRRRRRSLAAGLAALTVVAVLVGVTTAGGGTGSRVFPIAGPTEGVPAELRAVYPARVPGDPGRTMPPDRVLGPAAFFYAPCMRLPDCWPNLVLPDGRAFAVPLTIDSGHPRDLTLSPNGRYAGWGYQVDAWYEVTDLVTGQRRTVGDNPVGLPITPWAWSPDSRWLLLAQHRDGDVSRFFLADMRGGVRELPASLSAEPVVGVLGSGQLVVPAGRSLRLVDPDTGRINRSVPLAQAAVGLLVAPCSCAVYTVVSDGTEVGRPVGLHGIDLGDGHVFTRLDLPTSAESGWDEPGVWTVGSVLPGGVVLVRDRPAGTEIEVMNDVTGARTHVSVLPPHSYVRVRGEFR